MEIPNGLYRTSIKALILDKDKRFLLSLEDNGLWNFPGGGMDFGEEPWETLEREIREETGLKTKNVSKIPKYFIQFKNERGYWTTETLFEVEVVDLNIHPSNECLEIKFVDIEEAKTLNVHPSVFKVLELMKNGRKI